MSRSSSTFWLRSLLVRVEIVPSGPGRRAVAVDGEVVGTVRCVPASEAKTWHDYKGTFRSGCRWLPVGVDPRVEGPQTHADAALLLLALLDYDREAAIRALYGSAA